MKNHYILFLLLFALESVNAQDWKPLTKGEKYNYTKDKGLTTIWADSVKEINSDSVFYLNRICKRVKEGTPPFGPESFFLENQSQFFLSKIIYSPSSDVVMEENDSVKFLLKPRANLNDTWVFDALKHDTAKVVNVLTMPVFGKMDSVKIITLTTHDSIVLSKNYGILKFPDRDTIHHHVNLVGIEGRNVGTMIPKFKDIFDFQVSDIFYYHHIYDTYHFHVYTEKKMEITAKKIIGDTIKYTVNYKSRLITIDDLMLKRDTVYKNVGDSAMVYVNNSVLFDGYGGMILKDGPKTGDNYYKPLNVSYSKPFQVYTKNRPFNSFGKSLTTDSILEYHHEVYSDNMHSAVYGSRLGLIDDFIFDYMSGTHYYLNSEEILIGYTRDNITTGTVINDNIFTAVPRYENDLSFKIYPNPVENVFTIENESSIKQGSIQLFDINGRELLQQKITSIKTEIDISTLAKGVYFVKVITNDAVGIRKIIKD